MIGHPDFWQAVARTVPQLPPDVVGVTSTAPCLDTVSEAIESAGLARLFHIYGSSETAGIGWRASFRDPYQLFAHWAFAADGPNDLVRRLPGGGQLAAARQDRLERLDERSFLVGARHDAGVQVGGVNVFPSHVSTVLKRHPLVQDAAVRLMRPDEGARLKAYVVPKPQVSDIAMFLAQLRSWIDTQLAVAERPKAICVGSQLPLTASGKPSDWSIEAEQGAQIDHRH